ncbi:RNA-binding ribosome biosynthesis protein Mak21 [Malassezia pachydermatis]
MEREKFPSTPTDSLTKPTAKKPAVHAKETSKLKAAKETSRPEKSAKPERPAKPQAILRSEAPRKHVVFGGDDDQPAPAVKAGLRLLIEPVSDWSNIKLPVLEASHVPSQVDEAAITALHELGKQTLESENDMYARLASGEGGKNVILGSLNFSDLQFARTLLTSSKASTLSDRISAVTLLLQSSPIHNLKALDTLMTMAGKPGREEASRATRALADWLSSGGGLGAQKLHYFRDQPLLAKAAAVYKAGTNDALRFCTCVWAFEDMLKRTYFAFVQILERQSHDTLLFMRRQAVTQVFVLLRDKAEQEHNLLRLLTNKLGDPDRSVASKASTHLMELMQVHPAMKAIVLREVSEEVLRSQVSTRRTGKEETNTKGNQHATYYGVFTMNQTLFTAQDAPLANELFTIYFQLFEVCLQQENPETPSEDTAKPKDKKRWRDQKKASTPAHKTASDVYGRLLAGILAGIRRVFPFTTLDTDALDQHLHTLFRITHTHSFNIAVQALQLIFQVAIGIPKDGDTARGFSPKVADRYYRTLYDSMLDSRLATTSKQAMYLNLVYKSIKSDTDPERVKAMVKRLCQILHTQEPPFIVGALVLLGEIFKAKPGLRAMITEPEEEGTEHFVDVRDDEDEADVSQVETRTTSTSYDGRKRDPRFAHAGETALWDLLPLVHHFHPSVSLNAKQLLDGIPVTSNADLTLNTLMHFLDRFVFRNPKKHVAVKGSSIMQPALSGDATDNVLVRRTNVPLSYVNTPEFWTLRPELVPADQQFFHQYFQTKLKRTHAPAEKDHEADLDEVASDDGMPEDGDDSSTDDDEEKEIWKAMKSSMPGPKEMEEEIDDDLDDDILAELEDDEDEKEEDDEDEDDIDEDDDGHVDHDDSATDDEANMFLEDEDDLVPFTNFDEEEEAAVAGKKRSADEAAESTSKKTGRTSQRRKRRALPEFASADEYAHLLDSDDEGNL